MEEKKTDLRDERQSREKGRLRMHLGLGLEKHIIYTFFLSAGLVEPVRFNQFQTLETEPNRNFFVIF
jgi:hypothetical protein